MLCLPRHPKSNTKGCKAFPNAFPSLLFSQQLWWTKAFGWEQAYDHSGDLAALSHSGSPSPSLSNPCACSSLDFWWLDVSMRAVQFLHPFIVELMGYLELLRSWGDKWEEACVKKGLVCQGFGGQAGLQFAGCCYGTGKRMSDIGATSLGSSWGRCVLRVSGKIKKVSGNLMNEGQQEQCYNKIDAWATPAIRLEEFGCNVFAWLSAVWGKNSFTATATLCTRLRGIWQLKPHPLTFIKTPIYSMWFSAMRHIRKQQLTSIWKVA